MEEEFEKIVGVRLACLHACLLMNVNCALFYFILALEKSYQLTRSFDAVECCGASLLLSCYLMLMVNFELLFLPAIYFCFLVYLTSDMV